MLNENKICKQEREEKQERPNLLFLACREGGMVVQQNPDVSK